MLVHKTTSTTYFIFSYFVGYFFVDCLRACNVTYAALFKQRTKKEAIYGAQENLMRN